MGNGTLSKIFNKSKKYLGLTLYKHFYSSECVDGCGGEQLRLAKITLKKNNSHKTEFSTATTSALEHGHRKGRKILKTFILKPLQRIFNAFSNPS